MSDEADASSRPTEVAAMRAAARLVATSDDLAELAMMASDDARWMRDERAMMQRSIDHFSVESLFPSTGGAGGALVRVDPDAIRRDAERVDVRIDRAQSVTTSLTAIAQQLREHAEALADDETEGPGSPPGDLRVQLAATAAREEERGRLAREIHDGPAQVLANALFALEIAEQVARRDPTRVADELAQIRALLRDGVGEIRRFMNGLRPAMLTDRGLVPTLQRWIADYNRFFGMAITFDATTTTDDLTPDQQLALFRIVQEALQNVQKHAGTRNGHVTVRRDPGGLELTIRDEGGGIRPGTGMRSSDGGAGLPGMRERARLIGSTLTVETGPREGTTIRVRLSVGPRRDDSESGRIDTRRDRGMP